MGTGLILIFYIVLVALAVLLSKVEKLLVSVDDVSGELADSLCSPLEMRESESLSKSIEDLTSIFAGKQKVVIFSFSVYKLNR